jgi:hypothetical protein
VKRLAFAAVTAACTSQAPTLIPQAHIEEHGLQLVASVAFGPGDPGVAVDATYRGQTIHLRDDSGAYDGSFDLDDPVGVDEPVTLTIDGDPLTITAPPTIDLAPVPLFVPRGEDTTIQWTTTSADAMDWYVNTSVCVEGSDTIAPWSSSTVLGPATWRQLAQGTCSATLVVRRRREVALAPGGTLDFVRSAEAEFASY